MTLLSMHQYAKHRGVTVQAVSKAVKNQRITCARNEKGHALIDPAVADRQWAENSEGVRPNYGLPSGDPPPQAEGPKGPSVYQSAAILKAYQARLAKLEFDEKSAKLHDVEQCKRDSFKVARSVRDALMGIPDRLSAEMAGETDQFKIRQRLETEIRQALETLAVELESPSG